MATVMNGRVVAALPSTDRLHEIREMLIDVSEPVEVFADGLARVLDERRDLDPPERLTKEYAWDLIVFADAVKGESKALRELALKIENSVHETMLEQGDG